jgi:hypothetical protein
VNWTIGYDNNRGLIIDLNVRKLQLMPIVRVLDRLSDDTLIISSLVAVVAVSLALAFIVYAFLEFPSPAPFWNWVADNIRLAFMILLPLTLAFGADMLGKRLFSERYTRSRSIGALLFWLSTFLGTAAFGLWILVCPVREPSQPYVDYLNSLRAGSVASIFVSLSPWLALALKTMDSIFRAPS